MTSDEVKLLSQYADVSAFSIEEWKEALQVIGAWLEKENRTADFETTLGFITCCADSTGAPGLVSLAHLTQDMLIEHGFERSKPS